MGMPTEGTPEQVRRRAADRLEKMRDDNLILQSVLHPTTHSDAFDN
jgi:hypothetical protein